MEAQNGRGPLTRGSVCLVLGLLAMLAFGTAQAQLRWSWTNPAPTGNAFISVAFGNGLFVAVSAQGDIATSADGAHWTSRESATDASLRAVVFADDRFVVAAVDGTILSSSDGVEWTSRSSGATFDVIELGYGNGTFVLGGLSSDFLTSSDAVTWTPHSTAVSCQFGSLPYSGQIAFGAGVFVSAGGCVMSSPDGITWTRHDLDGGNRWGVTYANDRFVMVGDSGAIDVSADGSIWQPLPNSYSAQLVGVAYDGARTVALGNLAYTNVGVSTDGTNFDFASIDYALGGNSAKAYLKAIVYGNGVFVAVGEAGAIAYSTDGVDWMSATFDSPDTLRGVAYGNGTYVAVGDHGTIEITANGHDWTAPTSESTNDLYGIAYADARFVAVGDHGTILTSDDATTWQAASSGSDATLHAIAYGNALLVAVGANGTVLTSPDAAAWTPRNSGTAYTLRSVIYGEGRFVAVGDAGVIVTSTNGASWSTVDSGTLSTALFAVVYGNSQFVAFGQSSIPRYSNDGVVWQSPPASLLTSNYAAVFGNGVFLTQNEDFDDASGAGLVGYSGHPMSTQLTIRGLAYGSAGYVGVGDSGAHVLHTGGVAWENINPGSPSRNSRLTGIAVTDGTFMAVGLDFNDSSETYRDIAMTSTDGESWTPVPTGDVYGLVGVAAHDGKFVAIGGSGIALVRENGAWTSHDVGIDDNLYGIAYANDRFIALGNAGKISTSLDAIAWQPQTLPTPNALFGAAYGNGRYVIAGYDLWYSADAQNWTIGLANDGRSYTTVAFGNNRFVAIGTAGLATSADGATWNANCTFGAATSLTFDGTKFVAVGYVSLNGLLAGNTFVSFDGLEWRHGTLHMTATPWGLAHANDRYVAVGENGSIVRSEDDLVFSSRFDGLVCPQ